MIKGRIAAIRRVMLEKGVNWLYVPTEDFHQSEYVRDYFKCREYLSGFTGSAGTLLVGRDMAGLWTDGRYHIQAAKELDGTGIELFCVGKEGVKQVLEYLLDNVKSGDAVALDGRVVDAKTASELEIRLNYLGAALKYDMDLVGEIWKERPMLLPSEEIYNLDYQYCGKSTVDKLCDIRAYMESVGATCHVIASLEDIAWILNVRGNDIKNCPVVLSYLVITKDFAVWFTHEDDMTEEVSEAMKKAGVVTADYNDLFRYLRNLPVNQRVLLDKKKINFAIKKVLENRHIQLIDYPNPSLKMKAMKNETEQKNLVCAHIKDGLAVTKFMYWLKTNIGKIPMTETSAAKYLENLRAQMINYKGPSFDTISAYNENAAMMHYSASEESCATLKAEGMLLVDSGGHYLEGSTDITRTFILGPVADEWKKHYTLVVKGMLALSDAKFLYGCNGQNLDILARGPLWSEGIDYRCGTGHGVGYMLSVHEGPNGFRWKKAVERNDSGVFEEGMVTSNEPGVYIEGSHGIRIENELLCKEAYTNEYGRYMCFETLTLAPVDIDGIDTRYLQQEDIDRLNRYHEKVYCELAEYLDEDERKWLAEYTQKIAQK